MNTKRPKRKDANTDRRSKLHPNDPLERLQKVLATAGFGSRRKCEELIEMGRVEVDRHIVTQLGTKVAPTTQTIRVDGEPIKLPKKRYFVVNKPPGVLSTSSDPWARMRVIDLVDSEDRMFTVGRLDMDTSGLILVTNDGQLANELAHPRYAVTKTYLATVAGKPSIDVLKKLKKGIYLAEAQTNVQSVRLKKGHHVKSILEIVLAEGRNREIRRMLARVGHKVLQLRRIALGPIRLGDLPDGAYRELSLAEIKALRNLGKAPTKRRQNTNRRSAVGARHTRKKTTRKQAYVGTVLGAETEVAPSKKKRPATDGKKSAQVGGRRSPTGKKANLHSAAKPGGKKKNRRGGVAQKQPGNNKQTRNAKRKRA